MEDVWYFGHTKTSKVFHHIEQEWSFTTSTREVRKTRHQQLMLTSVVDSY